MESEQPVSQPVKLTENEARRVRSGVTTMRGALREILRNTDPSNSDQLVHLVDYDISPKLCVEVRDRVAGIEQIVDELATIADATPLVSSARRAASAQASYAWAASMEVHPRHFNEVGDADPARYGSLPSYFEQIAGAFLDLAQFLDSPSEPAESGIPGIGELDTNG